MSRKFKHYILTGNSVVIQFEDGLVPVDKAHPLYQRIKENLASRSFDALSDLLDAAKRIVRYSNGQFWVKDGVVMIGAETLPEALSKRLLNFVDNNLDTTPLVSFYHNLRLNPSDDSKRDLYAFLEHNGIPITEDGCFIAYKRVSDSFKDLHTGKLDYSVGQIVSMPRENCDPDRNNTCSKGLHVAAYKYAHDFYGNGNLLEVKVNPKNVVAVPVDYNNEKMRVCELLVVKVAGSPRKELVYPRYSVGEHVECDNDDGSTVLGVIKAVIPAGENEVQASYEVVLEDDDSLVTYKESDLGYADEDEGYDYEELDGFEDEQNDDDELDEYEVNDDHIEVVRLEDIERRVSNLEKNAATKKDVADSTNQIVQKLDSINQKMDNA